MELGSVLCMALEMSSTGDSHRARMSASLSQFNFICQYLSNKHVFKLLEAGSVALNFLLGLKFDSTISNQVSALFIY